MSVTGIPQDHHADRLLKKSFHRRNDSGELDVFEAARYFSGVDASVGQNGFRGRRISLDMPIRHVLNPSQTVNADPKQTTDKNKHNNKQPSSPGGRLASFLNSLFSQSAEKKKKKSKPSSMKDDDNSLGENPNGRRKRRSSISHFRSSSVADSKSSSSSGFRTPPAYAQTPSKSYKDFKTLATKQIIKPNNASEDHVVKDSKNSGNVLSEPELRRFDDEHDNGAESDSSSDLFELQNYDLGCYSSGLPVYETTNMVSIKRGEPISSA